MQASFCKILDSSCKNQQWTSFFVPFYFLGLRVNLLEAPLYFFLPLEDLSEYSLITLPFPFEEDNCLAVDKGIDISNLRKGIRLCSSSREHRQVSLGSHH
jgi:hypothetical protein